jgi:HKD family nuclease
MLDIYTNANTPEKNRFSFVFEELAKNNNLRIAVPFFTQAKILEAALDNNCTIDLIVKLGDIGTNPYALQKLILKPNINIRFLNYKFHSKLYIFGNECAFVGSSNLTENGLFLNSEINVKIEYEDPRFEFLNQTFDEYWDSAIPLKEEDLQKYITIYLKYTDQEIKRKNLEKETEKLFRGIFQVQSLVQNCDKKNKKNDSIKKFMQDYQVFLKKFTQLKNIYKETGMRRIDESLLPLRLEIDQFLSWIRETKAKDLQYLKDPINDDKKLRDFVTNNIIDFCSDNNFTYIEEIVDNTYPLIQNYLESEEKINALNKNDIFELFYNIHTFKASLRYKGKKEEAKNKFFIQNTPEKIKTMLKYLFFNKDNSYEQRIADCQYDNQYKLDSFGENSIKELFGWVNKNDVPIYNERIAKSMQWLGFGKL